jgi:hypothetical protein
MRGQAAFEFIVLAVAVLILLFTFFVITFSRQFYLQDIQTQDRLDGVCSDVANKINQAIYFGGGFSQNVTLPNKIYGSNYSIEVQSSTKTLICRTNETNQKSAIKFFIADKVNNMTGSTSFFVPIREVKINNTEGTVVIS